MTQKVRTIYLFNVDGLRLKHRLRSSILLFSLTIFAFLQFLQPKPVAAQDDILCPDFTAADQQQIYDKVDFGESIIFHFCWHNMPEIEKASIEIEIENFDEPRKGEAIAPTDAGAGDLINLNHELNLAQTLILPFSNIRYTWTLHYKTGETEAFPTQSIEYTDNRVEWQTFTLGNDTSESIQVHSETQHRAIAEIALSTINRLLPEIKEVILTDNSLANQDIDVYLYPDNETFQSALRLTGLDWVAGKASPEIGVIMVPITSGMDETLAQTNLEQRLPHELSHLLVYRATGDGYHNLPSWFDEGLAASFEVVPNPNYAASLQNVTDATQLIPFSEMCINLPVQPTEMALRGYAQSYALVQYIFKTYGTEGIQQIIGAAAAGSECNDVVAAGLNDVTQDQLIQNWLTTIQPDLIQFDSPIFAGIIIILAMFLLMSIILWKRTYGTRTFSEFNG
ncbi:MAG: peptidase MA family metallohydrolase [Anaerolineae bacterium]